MNDQRRQREHKTSPNAREPLQGTRGRRSRTHHRARHFPFAVSDIHSAFGRWGLFCITMHCTKSPTALKTHSGRVEAARGRCEAVRLCQRARDLVSVVARAFARQNAARKRRVRLREREQQIFALAFAFVERADTAGAIILRAAARCRVRSSSCSCCARLSAQARSLFILRLVPCRSPRPHRRRQDFPVLPCSCLVLQGYSMAAPV